MDIADSAELQYKKELALLLAERERRFKYDKFHSFYFQEHMIDPQTGMDISRHLYIPHIKFMNATAITRELAFIAPNRSGKSETGAFMVVCWLTAEYPDWWEGKKFDPKLPLDIIAFGESHIAVRDVAQKKLIGSTMDPGSGMLPKEMIHKVVKKPGVPDAILDLYVKNKFGTIHHVQFFSYDQESNVLKGRELHAAWFDEECLNTKLYNEVLMRTMTTEGVVFQTYTPLDGFTEGMQRFLNESLEYPENGIVLDSEGKDTGRFVIHCGWDTAPHLTEAWKEDMKKRYTGPELIARTEGRPTIGAGQIYPYTRESMTCESFKIPDWWPRCYGLDFGWKGEAVIWLAKDPDTGVLYAYSEYYIEQQPAHRKISDIKERLISLGPWMRGAADPSKGGRDKDGMLLIEYYIERGLDLTVAENSLSIISQIQGGFESGMIKIMSDRCPQLLNQLAPYRYDEKTMKPALHQKDHCLDAFRYGFSIFDVVAVSKEQMANKEDVDGWYTPSDKNPVTGY